MSSSEDKGKRPARRMGLLIAALVIGATILIVLWMRDTPSGVKPSASETPRTIDLATGLASHDGIPSAFRCDVVHGRVARVIATNRRPNMSAGSAGGEHLVERPWGGVYST
jgi:hypothetical protein